MQSHEYSGFVFMGIKGRYDKCSEAFAAHEEDEVSITQVHVIKSEVELEKCSF